jgi:hypothetical protein
MTTASTPARKWPRRRLLIRSNLSAFMPFGWTWVAVTALIPYFIIGSGSGTSTIEALGITRATWLSLHVWSSLFVGALTIVHVVLNRKGVGRSLRIVRGGSGNAGATTKKRGYAWIAAVALLSVAIGGGFVFAAFDTTHGGGDRSKVVAAESVADPSVATSPRLGRGSNR